MLSITCNFKHLKTGSNVLTQHADIAIVGAGIAGLSLAIGLARLNIRTTLYEDDFNSTSQGYGIQLGPNATRYLEVLGVDCTKLAMNISKPDYLIWLDGQTDDSIQRFTMGHRMATKFGAPYYQIFRPDLINVLTNQCSVSEHVDLVSECVQSISPEEPGVRVNTVSQTRDYKLVVAADGVQSTIRNCMMPAQQKLTLHGIALRCLIPFNKVPKELCDGNTRTWLANKFHVVAYEVAKGELLNCVFVLPANKSESTSAKPATENTPEHILQSEFNPISPLIKQLVESCQEEEIKITPLYSQDAFVQPNKRVVYIGDAWHAMLPYTAQGAAMAIEDARVLTQLISKLEASEYEDLGGQLTTERQRRVRNVAAMSERNGRIYHWDRTKTWVRMAHNLSGIGFWWVTKKLYRDSL